MNNSSSSKTSAARLQSYKHRGKDTDELRRRRNQHAVSLRKNKRDEQVQCKRNLLAEEIMVDDSDDDDDSSASRLTNLDEILLKAQDADLNIRYEGIRSARRLLSKDENPPIDDLIHMNFLPILVQCLTYDEHPDLQFEATWALTNIASGTSQQTQAVADANALPHLLRLLSSTQLYVCEQAVWALGNLIGDGARLRDQAIQLGVIKPLIDYLSKEISISFLRNITWVMVNLCRHKDTPVSFDAVREMLPALKYLLSHSDPTILVDCTWAVAYLLEGDPQLIQLVVEFEMVPLMVRLLNHADTKILIAALRAVGNVATGSDEQTQVVLNHGALHSLLKLINHQREKVTKEAVWFLSNVAAGNQLQTQAVVDSQLLPDIIRHLQFSDISIQREAAWCISNLTISASVQQIEYLVRQQAIVPLCNLLAHHDSQLVQVCLDALSNILKQTPEEQLDVVTMEIEQCGGRNKIETLQSHSNGEIYQLAYTLVEKFFLNDTDDDLSSTGHVPGDEEYPFGNQTVPDDKSQKEGGLFHF